MKKSDKMKKLLNFLNKNPYFRLLIWTTDLFCAMFFIIKPNLIPDFLIIMVGVLFLIQTLGERLANLIEKFIDYYDKTRF